MVEILEDGYHNMEGNLVWPGMSIYLVVSLALLCLYLMCRAPQ